MIEFQPLASDEPAHRGDRDGFAAAIKNTSGGFWIGLVLIVNRMGTTARATALRRLVGAQGFKSRIC